MLVVKMRRAMAGRALPWPCSCMRRSMYQTEPWGASGRAQWDKVSLAGAWPTADLPELGGLSWALQEDVMAATCHLPLGRPCSSYLYNRPVRNGT